MAEDLSSGDLGIKENNSRPQWKPPTTMDVKEAAVSFLRTVRMTAQALASSFLELCRPHVALSPRAIKIALLCEVLLIFFLMIGLLGIHVEIAQLRETALAPIGKGGSRTIMARMCKDTTVVKDVYNKMHNVVLIINTNYEDAARSTSAFLRAVYGRFFDTVVIISKESIPELGVEARGQSVWRDKWYWAYWHMPKVISDYPDAEGYLWTNDDVAINYWRLLKGNLSKIWFTNDPSHPESRYFPFDKNEKAKWSDWAAEPECRENAFKAYKAMEERYRKQFDASIQPLSGVYPKRIVDLFYVPQRFAKPLSFDLIPIFREYKLWSEVALPMIFFALDGPNDFGHTLDDMVYSWGHWDQSKVFDPSEFWRPNISAFHPWKLSKQAARNQLIMAFSSVDPCVLQLLPQAQPTD